MVQLFPVLIASIIIIICLSGSWIQRESQANIITLMCSPSLSIAEGLLATAVALRRAGPAVAGSKARLQASRKGSTLLENGSSIRRSFSSRVHLAANSPASIVGILSAEGGSLDQA